jgi:cysteinyl-tRNA synthetase
MLKSDLSPADKFATALDFDKVFGLELKKIIDNKETVLDIPEEILNIVEERKTARENKDWKKSDELREKIKSLGYELKDTPEGQKITKI